MKELSLIISIFVGGVIVLVVVCQILGSIFYGFYLHVTEPLMDFLVKAALVFVIAVAYGGMIVFAGAFLHYVVPGLLRGLWRAL